jgi:thiaminase
MAHTLWMSGCKVRLENHPPTVIKTQIRGLAGDAASLLVVLAACLLGYGEVGLWLQREANRPQSWVQIENNPYRKWIEDYSGEGYQGVVKVGIGEYGL